MQSRTGATLVFLRYHACHRNRPYHPMLPIAEKRFNLIDGELVSVEAAATETDSFTSENEASCLNFAGPREGSCTGICAYVFETIPILLSRYNPQLIESGRKGFEAWTPILMPHQPYEESP